jgi:hypothetical protein
MSAYDGAGDQIAGAIVAFSSKRAACKRAAKYFGYESYTEAKRHGWCEVRPLCNTKE